MTVGQECSNWDLRKEWHLLYLVLERPLTNGTWSIINKSHEYAWVIVIFLHENDPARSFLVFLILKKNAFQGFPLRFVVDEVFFKL
jgi:hypothetical protein